jgi:hypothetical protein
MVTVPNYSVLAVLLSDAGVERDPASEAQASAAAATEREMQAKYRGESVDDGDLGSLEDEPREPHRSFYHPYG